VSRRVDTGGTLANYTDTVSPLRSAGAFPPPPAASPPARESATRYPPPFGKRPPLRTRTTGRRSAVRSARRPGAAELTRGARSTAPAPSAPAGPRSPGSPRGLASFCWEERPLPDRLGLPGTALAAPPRPERTEPRPPPPQLYLEWL